MRSKLQETRGLRKQGIGHHLTDLFRELGLNIYVNCLEITEIFRSHFTVNILFPQCLVNMVHLKLLSEFLCLELRLGEGHKKESVLVMLYSCLWCPDYSDRCVTTD